MTHVYGSHPVSACSWPMAMRRSWGKRESGSACRGCSTCTFESSATSCSSQRERALTLPAISIVRTLDPGGTSLIFCMRMVAPVCFSNAWIFAPFLPMSDATHPTYSPRSAGTPRLVSTRWCGISSTVTLVRPSWRLFRGHGRATAPCCSPTCIPRPPWLPWPPWPPRPPRPRPPPRPDCHFGSGESFGAAALTPGSAVVDG